MHGAAQESTKPVGRTAGTKWLTSVEQCEEQQRGQIEKEHYYCEPHGEKAKVSLRVASDAAS